MRELNVCLIGSSLLFTVACAGTSPVEGAGGAGGTGGANTCNCVAQTVKWGASGGMYPQVELGSIAPCRNFELERLFYQPRRPTIVCKRELEACGSPGIDVGDVNLALAHLDVQLALAAAPVTYGLPGAGGELPRFQITVGDKRIEAGLPCGSYGPGCTEVPFGVAALVNKLGELEDQERCETALTSR